MVGLATGIETGDGAWRMKFVRDSLLEARGCPAPWPESGRDGTVTGAGEDGRLAGRKNDGFLSTFMMGKYRCGGLGCLLDG